MLAILLLMLYIYIKSVRGVAKWVLKTHIFL
jgi:hypothetical protein